MTIYRVFQVNYVCPGARSCAKISVKPLNFVESGRSSVPYDDEKSAFQNYKTAVLSRLPENAKLVSVESGKTGCIIVTTE